MTDLETTYYIVGIVFMVVALVVLLGMVTALLVIRTKVVALEKAVQEKIHGVAASVEKVVEVANVARDIAKAVRK